MTCDNHETACIAYTTQLMIVHDACMSTLRYLQSVGKRFDGISRSFPVHPHLFEEKAVSTMYSSQDNAPRAGYARREQFLVVRAALP